jgi:hypothetical protein
MTNVVSMESKLEELERRLGEAERYWDTCLERLHSASNELDFANTELAAAIEALEKHV